MLKCARRSQNIRLGLSCLVIRDESLAVSLAALVPVPLSISRQFWKID